MSERTDIRLHGHAQLRPNLSVSRARSSSVIDNPVSPVVCEEQLRALHMAEHTLEVQSEGAKGSHPQPVWDVVCILGECHLRRCR